MHDIIIIIIIIIIINDGCFIGRERSGWIGIWSIKDKRSPPLTPTFLLIPASGACFVSFSWSHLNCYLLWGCGVSWRNLWPPWTPTMGTLTYRNWGVPLVGAQGYQRFLQCTFFLAWSWSKDTFTCFNACLHGSFNFIFSQTSPTINSELFREQWNQNCIFGTGSNSTFCFTLLSPAVFNWV